MNFSYNNHYDFVTSNIIDDPFMDEMNFHSDGHDITSVITCNHNASNLHNLDQSLRECLNKLMNSSLVVAHGC